QSLAAVRIIREELTEMEWPDFLDVGVERFPRRAFFGASFSGRFDTHCHVYAPFVVRLLRAGDFRLKCEFGVLRLSQRRNPPRNALALSPNRHRGGSTLSLLAFPPPRTTSSGWSAATRRATTSATSRLHFFVPNFFNPRNPT